MSISLNTFLLATLATFVVGGSPSISASPFQTPAPISYSESVPYKPRTLPTPKPGSKLEKLLQSKNKDRSDYSANKNLSVPRVTDPEFVVVPVTVIDQAGNFVSGLDKADFKVFIDNKLEIVTTFAAETQPYHVIIVIDAKAWTAYPVRKLEDVVITIIDQLGRNDRAMLVTYTKERKVLADFTSDKEKLRKAARNLHLSGKDSSLFDTLQYLCHSVLPSIEGNKAVVLVSDGYDNRSTDSDYQKSLLGIENTKAIVFPVYLDNFEKNWRSMTRGSGTTTHLGVSGAIASELNVPADEQDRFKWQYEIGGFFMNDLVFVSGGRAMFANDLLIEPTKRKYDIGQQLRAQYYLTLSSPKGVSGTRRQVLVRVNRPSLAVLARGSYLVP